MKLNFTILALNRA